jgi:hypothetical protein
MTKSIKRHSEVSRTLSTFSKQEVATALEEDGRVQKILQTARSQRPGTPITAKTKREATAFMVRMRAGSERALRRGINRKELLTIDELISRIGGNRQWVSYALRTGRLFSIQDSSGVQYFPSFFAGPLSRRRLLGQVAKILAGLPERSQLHFFVSLGGTPLDALNQGRLHEVRQAAISFKEN